MIELKADLHFTSNDITSFEFPDYTANNVSRTNDDTLGNYDSGKAPFRLGYSALYSETKYTLESNYDGYMSKESFNGANPFRIFLTGKDIEYIFIKFDELSNTFPTDIKVEVYTKGVFETIENPDIVYNQVGYKKETETDYTNDNPFFGEVIQRMQDPYIGTTLFYLIITTNNWQTDLQEADSYKVSALDTSVAFSFSNKEIDNLSLTLQMIDDNSTPDYTLIGNYSTIGIRDSKDQIDDLASSGLDLLGRNENMELSLNERKIGTFFVDRYDTDNYYNYTLELESNIVKFNDYIIPAMQFGKNVNLLTIYTEITRYFINIPEETLSKKPKFIIAIAGGEYQKFIEFKNDLSNYIVPIAFINEGTFFAQLKKLCQCVGWYISENKDGKLVFIKGDM